MSLCVLCFPLQREGADAKLRMLPFGIQISLLPLTWTRTAATESVCHVLQCENQG